MKAFLSAVLAAVLIAAVAQVTLMYGMEESAKEAFSVPMNVRL